MTLGLVQKPYTRFSSKAKHKLTLDKYFLIKRNTVIFPFGKMKKRLQTEPKHISARRHFNIALRGLIIWSCKALYMWDLCFKFSNFFWSLAGVSAILLPSHLPRFKNDMNILTHWGQDKMPANFLMTFSNAFSWMKIYEFHWSLFQMVQLAIFHHCFR